MFSDTNLRTGSETKGALRRARPNFFAEIGLYLNQYIVLLSYKFDDVLIEPKFCKISVLRCHHADGKVVFSCLVLNVLKMQ